MLNLICGRGGSGKTTQILTAIRQACTEGQRGLILLVPEQYSHGTERQLCAFCGDSVSLHAEVLSFSLLSARVFAQSGGLADSVLDDGGRLLVLLSALRAVEGSLRLFRPMTRRPEFLSGLLRSVDELKTCRVGAETLTRAAEEAGGALGDKLHDLSLILGAYDAITAQGQFDPRDRMEKLRDDILSTGFGAGRKIYVNHFTDFTAQELAVLEALLQNGAELTVALCCDDLYDPAGWDCFAVARRTGERLLRMAAENQLDCRVIRAEAASARAPALAHLEQHLFSGESPVFAGDAEKNLALFSCPDSFAECRLAAAEARRLVREEGYRWRDIAIAVNGFSDYESAAESIFSDYELPVFFSRKTDMLQKPIPALVSAALGAIDNGYAYADMFRYLKTGLAGLDRDECDILENYVLKWNIRGSLWTRDAAWTLHPRGFEETMDEADQALLNKIDELRRRAAMPLKRLADRGQQAGTARQQVLALYDFLESLGLEAALSRRAAAFRADGREALAEEYVQLWDILVGSLEQCAAILGDMPMEQAEFGRLLALLLSQYDVGTIPVSMDHVNLGDLERVRAHPVKCLILMGATGDRLPRSSPDQDLLSDAERETLSRLGVELSGGENDALLRELQLIYAGMSLPAERLVLTWPLRSGAESVQPSFVSGRIRSLFDLDVTPYSAVAEQVAVSAPLPALELAAAEPESPYALAAAAHLASDPQWAPRLEAVRRGARMPAAALSPAAVSGLYGKKINMTASRVDKYKACRFAYFLQYGLKAQPRKKAEMDAPEIGTFLHFVLESVAREVKLKGGFNQVTDNELKTLVECYVNKYAESKLGGLSGKTSRFRYLFGRLVRQAHTVVLDMAAELRRSDFEPLDFELRFAEGGDLPPISGGDQDLEMRVSGVVDRVDGWLHEGKLYLRVVDYKTGRKKFDLSDIWYGMGMQMLMYLFMLEQEGEARYGAPIVPAGVLYTPARDVLVSADRSSSPEDLLKERMKSLRRSGLILGEPAVIEAMEKGSTPQYIPVRFTKDGSAGGSLATAEQLGLLRRHIEKILRDITAELKAGGVPADPYVTGSARACDFCEFAPACHFDESAGDCGRSLPRLREPEVWDYIRKEAEA